MKRDTRFLASWIALSAAGMAIGVFAAAEVIALTVFRWDTLYRWPAGTALLLILLFAGAAHGAAMGAMQSILLHRRLAMDRASWILATAAGAGIAWSAGGVVNLLDQEPWDSSERTAAIVLGGMVLGAILGIAQWLVLRRQLPDCTAWIPANSLAWIAGTGLGVYALESFNPNATAQQFALSAAFGTLVPGIAVGVVTGFTMLALLTPDRRHARTG